MEDLEQCIAELAPEYIPAARQALARVEDYNRGNQTGSHELTYQPIKGIFGAPNLNVMRISADIRLILRVNESGKLVPLHIGRHDEVYDWVKNAVQEGSLFDLKTRQPTEISTKTTKPVRSDFLFGTRVLTVIACRIETLAEIDKEIDVIVSSDDNYLTHGGGVSAAIWQSAGEALEEYVADRREKLSLTDVWPSVAGNIGVKAIYHAVTLDFDTNKQLSAVTARELYGKILDLAGDTSVKKLGLPLLGTGAGGLETDVSATALVEALYERSLVASTTVHAYLACMPDLYDACCRIAEQKQVHPAGPTILKAAQHLPVEQKDVIVKLWQQASGDKELNYGLSAVRILELLTDGLIFLLRQKAQEDCSDLHTIATGTANLTLGDTLAIVRDLLTKSNLPMDDSMVKTCRAAVDARNRLAHQAFSGDLRGMTEAVNTVLEASNLIAQQICLISGEETEKTPEETHDTIKMLTAASAVAIAGAVLGGPLGILVGGIAGRAIARSRITKPGTHKVKCANEAARKPDAAVADLMVASSQSLFGYTQPVRRLHRLLLDDMSDVLNAELVEELGKQGYSGSGELRILEYCVRTPDPVGLLISHIGAPGLRKRLREYGYNAFGPTTDANVLARQVLQHFGFPVLPAPQGLNSISVEIENAGSRLVSVNDIETLSGTVAQAAAEIEYLLQLFIRFLCKVLLGEAPEPYLYRKKRLNETWKLDQCSLGKLIEILIAMRKDISTTENAQAKVVLSLLSQRDLFPDGTNGLPELRNKFVHYKEVRTGSDITTMRQAAKGFFENARRVLAYLAEPEFRIFPRVIKVCGILVDEWGRRRIEALADDGRYECLFVDEVLEPGAIYLMHPVSNPMRVDPILVPAGDVEPYPQGGTRRKTSHRVNASRTKAQDDD